MNLYKWDLGCQQRIANGDAGMGECCRVNNDEIDMGMVSLMYQFYNLVLCVVLMEVKLMIEFAGFLFESMLNVGESLISVKTGFAYAQQV
jgi:hypothetical protein